MTAVRLLLVEDKDSFRRLLEKALQGTAFQVTALGDPREALEALGAEAFGLLVTDLRLPGFSGLELIRRAKRLQPALRVLLMSAFGEPRDIVEALRAGADDFLPKPFDLDAFLQLLEQLRSLAAAPPPDPREPWIAYSAPMRSLDQALHQAADSPLPVLFTGEGGTGRARAARRLHTLHDPRAPFLPLAAAALGPGGPDPDLVRLAEGGSVLLLGLEELAEGAAPGLLAALERPARVRWMGTVRAAEALPPALRERLGVLPLALPLLGHRREDLLPLFRAFLEAAVGPGHPLPLVPPLAEKDLLARPWPGQLHELAWCAREALRATSGAILGPLPPADCARGSLQLPWPEPATLEAMLAAGTRTLEGRLLGRALEAHDRDPARTARALGLSPRGLAQRLREHRISLEDGEGIRPPSD